MIEIPNIDRASNNILRIFIKTLLCVVSVFLVFDLASSFVSVYLLLPKEINWYFKVTMSMCLCIFAVIANGCGKILKVALGLAILFSGKHPTESIGRISDPLKNNGLRVTIALEALPDQKEPLENKGTGIVSQN